MLLRSVYLRCSPRVRIDNILSNIRFVSIDSSDQQFGKMNNTSNGNHSTTEEAVLRFAKLTPNATAPTRGSSMAAGYDLFSAYDYTIPARGRMLCSTDIQIAVPIGHYGRVAPRSGLAAKHSIDVSAGVVDADYRGNLMVLLVNAADKDFEVHRGDRIAQLICERISYPKLVEETSLDDTDRGSGGFGSTGR